jgi:hypothetical protein
MQTSRAERKRRREAALQKVSNGYGFSDTVSWVMSEWGCSRSTAQRDTTWAHNQLVQGMSSSDIQQLLAHLCTSTQRVALKAEGAGQYAAAIGALKLLHEMLIRPHQEAQQREQVRRMRPASW